MTKETIRILVYMFFFLIPSFLLHSTTGQASTRELLRRNIQIQPQKTELRSILTQRALEKNVQPVLQPLTDTSTTTTILPPESLTLTPQKPTTNTQPSSITSMKNIFTRIQGTINKKRTIIETGNHNLAQLLQSITRETIALFYLVDTLGNPVTKENITSAIGSKSIQIFQFSNLSEEQKELLNGTIVTVEENSNFWIPSYLNIVKQTRSRSLTGPSLSIFNQYWDQIKIRYTQALTKILKNITLSNDVAEQVGFTTLDNTPVTLLFFDDPFPAHTVPGSSKTPFKDLLGSFIARYGL